MALNLRLTHLILWVFVNYFERVHGSYHRIHCHKNILVDNLDEASLVILGVP